MLMERQGYDHSLTSNCWPFSPLKLGTTIPTSLHFSLMFTTSLLFEPIFKDGELFKQIELAHGESFG